MTIEQLEEALDRYGGDLGRWPPALRAEAEALIAADRKAAKLAHDTAALDAALVSAMRPLPVDAALVGRIVAGMAPGASHEVVLRPTTRLAAFAGAAMVALLVTGYAVGLALPQSQGEDTLASFMFGDSSASDTDSGSVL